MRLHKERCHQGRLQHAGISHHIGIKHIHTVQQLMVKLWKFRVFVSFAPIVDHHLIIGFDGKQSVGIYLVRMGSQIILHILDSAHQVLSLECTQYVI